MPKNMGTFAGFHYATLSMSCPRKFYFRHVLRYVPRFTATPLLNGTAFHLAKETFYKTHSAPKALAALTAFLRESKPSFERVEDYELVRARLPLAFSAWVEHFGNRDLRNYTFLAIERELKIPFTSGVVATVRPDAIVRDHGGNVFILETKTSGTSAEMTEIALSMSDQVTAQIAGARAAFPKARILGIVPDILFWLKSSRSARDIKCIRGNLIERSDRDVAEWRLSTETLLMEISQKVAALKTHDPLGPFPRNTEFCVSYNHRCEYLHICRERLTAKSRVPHGFLVEDAAVKKERKAK